MTNEDCIKTIEYLLRYYVGSPRVGHTRALWDGVGDENIDAIFVVINESHKKMFEPPEGKSTVVTMENLREKLEGHHKPLVLDNCVLEELFRGVVNMVGNQRSRIREMEARLGRIYELADISTIR